jgi:ligand-binding SRPBCC domain-containing protein
MIRISGSGLKNHRMKLYHLKQKQTLPVSLPEAWDFFSRPENLLKITPDNMGFDMTFISGSETEMYAGQLIAYKLKLFPGISTFWMTEIKHINEPYYFVDEQKFGPYLLWNHQHHFREVPEGVEMSDEITYAIPLGLVGRLANNLFVARKLKAIFEYREKTLKRLFPKTMVINRTDR